MNSEPPIQGNESLFSGTCTNIINEFMRQVTLQVTFIQTTVRKLEQPELFGQFDSTTQNERIRQVLTQCIEFLASLYFYSWVSVWSGMDEDDCKKALQSIQFAVRGHVQSLFNHAFTIYEDYKLQHEPSEVDAIFKAMSSIISKLDALIIAPSSRFQFIDSNTNLLSIYNRENNLLVNRSSTDIINDLRSKIVPLVTIVESNIMKLEQSGQFGDETHINTIQTVKGKCTEIVRLLDYYLDNVIPNVIVHIDGFSEILKYSLMKFTNELWYATCWLYKDYISKSANPFEFESVFAEILASLQDLLRLIYPPTRQFDGCP